MLPYYPGPPCWLLDHMQCAASPRGFQPPLALPGRAGREAEALWFLQIMWTFLPQGHGHITSLSHLLLSPLREPDGFISLSFLSGRDFPLSIPLHSKVAFLFSYFLGP